MALLLCGCSENAAVHLLCSLRVCTPSFNERSECQEEGWPAGPGRSLFTVSSANKPVARSAGEESLRRKECQQTSRPPGGERSRHVSTAAKLVRSIGGETPPLPGQSAPPLSQRNHKAQSSSALPPSMSVASARRRGGPAGPERADTT